MILSQFYELVFSALSLAIYVSGDYVGCDECWDTVRRQHPNRATPSQQRDTFNPVLPT